MDRDRRIAGAFCTLVAFVLFAGSTWAQDLKKVTVSTTSAGAAAGLISKIIDGRGLDKKHGLAIDFKYFDPAKGEEAVFFKTVDAGIFAPVSAARANLKGQKVQIFHPIMLSHFSILVPPESPLRTVDDLKGKKLGLLARVSAMYTSFATIVKMRGGDVEKDYKLTFGTPQALNAFLLRKDVDAIGQFDANTSKLIAANQARETATFNDLWRSETGQPLLIIGIAAHKGWIDKNLEAARGLGRAFTEGVRMLKTNPAKIIEEQNDFLGVKTPEEMKLVTSRMPGIFIEGWAPKLLENTKLLIQKNVEMKILEQMPKDEFLRSVD
ncbi:MAG: ABC transporter substrate-binding protein [Candidatus Tectomicrobia bacterium]|uniref:ABC transporter substrate-binding protein n=1 Tax=Tectimicrobiota bacterium TaxID=2528274 RepID=A0A932GM81_UNCTE|nr:ABC transporter substrate-binding protein [Candidatus Tectomicrobia bacterium]